MKARMVIVGPPGAGKGTQATRIAQAMGIPEISTGAIFRANIADGTELGKRAQGYIDAGNLVPDEVTDAMVRARLGQPDAAEGFLLDGYPRNVHQVTQLDQILADLGVQLDAVIELVIPDDAIVARLLRRAEIEGRADDTEPVIRRRIEVYHQQTQPVVDAYADRDIVLKIDGVGEIAEVHDRIVSALKKRFAL
ncbi:MAG: adenylate kinase [Actinomycetaceae bacterium]|nr:adenylate kinase [Actinomycetaceae bacterium]MDY5854814.1 adenylate kinase [Arcanobacterium sp.]